MNTDRDGTRIVRSWMDEGVTQLPDRVLDAVLDQVPATRQRRVPWWPALRLQSVNTLVEFGLAAAAVVAIVVFIGMNALGRSGTNVGGPGADPTPTPAPPTAEPSLSADADRDLPAGAFVLSDGGLDGGLRNLPVTVTIPGPGWYGTPAGGILGDVPEEQDFADRDAWMIGPFTGDIYVPADPCEWSTTMPDAPATTVDAVVTALQGQVSRDASEPLGITVGGHPGKSITLHVPEAADFRECDLNRVSGDAEFCTLTEDSPAVCHRYHQFPGQIDEIWVLDVDGTVTVVNASWGPATPDDAVAELRSIMESMNFE